MCLELRSPLREGSCAGAACRLRGAALVAVAAAVFVLAEAVAAEPLLACVIVGLVVANRRWACV